MNESEQLILPTGVPEAMTDPSGLTEAEAARRLSQGQGNTPAKDDSRTPMQIVAKNLFTRFNLLNVLLALALALVGAWRNMLFMGVVVSNTLIGAVQELRARKTVAELTLLAQTPATVRRDGEEKRVSPEALVQGDLVILRAGDQVPADAVVREGAGSADESLLTGESDPRYRKVRAIVNMFPGEGVVKVFFADTRRMRGARAAFDSRMIEELRNVLGEPNVVVK